jgi:hypothetical protein
MGRGISLIWTLCKCVVRVGNVGDRFNIPSSILVWLPSSTELGVCWDLVHLVRRPVFGILYQSRMIEDDDCGAVAGIKPKYSEETCSDTTLSTTNPTWPDLVSNLVCRGKPSTNTELRGVLRFWFHGMWGLGKCLPTFRRNLVLPSSGNEVETVCSYTRLVAIYHTTRRQIRMRCSVFAFWFHSGESRRRRRRVGTSVSEPFRLVVRRGGSDPARLTELLSKTWQTPPALIIQQQPIDRWKLLSLRARSALSKGRTCDTGGSEYLHCNPASRKSPLDHPVTGRYKYGDLVLQGWTQGWRFCCV